MNLQEVTFAIAIVFLLLSWLAFGLRCYVRLRMLHSWGLDDWFMLLAVILLSVLNSLIIKASLFGLNTEGIGLEQVISTALKFELISEVMYAATTCVLKVSIALLLLRITQERLYTHILRASIGFTCAYSLICFFMTLIQCWPVQYAWDFSIKDGMCISTKQRAGIAYAFSAFAIATDWFYAILPIFMIWGLMVNRLLKLYVTLVLGLGALACIATIVRLTYLVQLATHNSPTSEKPYSDQVLEVSIWTIVEPGIGIIASCAATLRPLLQYFKISGSTDESERSAAGWPRIHSNWQEMSQIQGEQRMNTKTSSNDGASSDVALCNL